MGLYVFLDRACPNDECPMHRSAVPGGPLVRYTWMVRANPDHGVNVPLREEEMFCRECGTESVPEMSIDLLVDVSPARREHRG